MSGKFILFTGEDGKYRFQLKAGNGQVILRSRAYASRKSALSGIASVQRSATYLTRFDKTNDDGRFRFVLRAGNRQVVGLGPDYGSERACDAGIAAVERHAPDAPVIDD
jgi:uncharacterized protein YegP (UPF0339 family)